MSGPVGYLLTGLLEGSVCWQGTTTPACFVYLVCALVVPLMWITTTQAVMTRHTCAVHAHRAMPVGQHSRVSRQGDALLLAAGDLSSQCPD